MQGEQLNASTQTTSSMFPSSHSPIKSYKSNMDQFKSNCSIKLDVNLLSDELSPMKHQPMLSSKQPFKNIVSRATTLSLRGRTTRFMMSNSTNMIPSRRNSIEESCQHPFVSQEFSSEYKILSYLGKGLNGKTFLVQCHKDLKLYAAKLYHVYDNEMLMKYQKEQDLMQSLDHPNLLKCYHRLHYPQSKEFILIMEYYDGLTMTQYINQKKQAQDEQVGRKAYQVVLGQLLDVGSYLLSQGVIHRDIHVDNVLINRHLDIRLIDFGSALHVQDTTQNECLSPNALMKFCAPEVQSGCGPTGISEAWQLGLVAYSLFHLRVITTRRLIKLMDKEEGEGNDGECAVLLSLLQPDPAQRIDAQEGRRRWLVRP